MRILFAGNPAIAIPTLASLLNHSGCEVVGVLVNPDAPQGRSKKMVASPVKSFAIEQNLLVLDPVKLDESVEMMITNLKCDLLVCFAYGKIFKKSFLSLFPQGGINIHPSLLPKYRGPTPIQAALLSGDSHSGITIQRLGLKMDAGNVLWVEPIDLTTFVHASAVEEHVADVAGRTITRVVEQLMMGTSTEHVQNEDDATYCHLIKPSDAQLHMKEQDGQSLYNYIRAYSYEPGAYCLYDDKRLFISRADFELAQHNFRLGEVLSFDKKAGFQVAVRDGYLWVKELQLEGKKRMDATSFFNGNRAIIGIILE